ncbi:MAG: RnfABCDGE type electron transport complex subunit D [Planctomycetota bacterium]|jgi:Na+-transporting NADH:ubiquinone oxidoreductase subunit NqrB
MSDTPTGPTTATTATTAAPRRGIAFPAIPPKYLSSILITIVLVVGQLVGDIVGGYERLVVALGTAIVAELVLSRLLRRKWPSLLSAYISGNSVAILTKPAGGLLWPFWMGSLIAITSKYVLSYRGRHLWNPTNFSFCALLMLAPGSVSILSHQWGNDVATWVVLAVGTLVVWRARVLHITVAYVISFLALGWVRSLINPQQWPLAAEIAPLTGPMYMLLIFFMLTDPRTSVSTRKGRILVVVLIAVVECLIRMLPMTGLFGGDERLLTAPPFFALFLVGPLAMWLDLRRKARAEAAA